MFAVLAFFIILLFVKCNIGDECKRRGAERARHHPVHELAVRLLLIVGDVTRESVSVWAAGPLRSLN